MEERFEIRVTGTHNATWQGTLCTPGEELPFCSALQLLLELDRRISKGPAADERRGQGL